MVAEEPQQQKQELLLGRDSKATMAQQDQIQQKIAVESPALWS